MKAITQDRYGSPDVLRFEDIDVPSTGEGEVLVRVRAASLNPLDWHFMRGEPYLVRPLSGWVRPRRTTPGADVGGVVEAVGQKVERFRPGDEVFGDCSGACAEYVKVSENDLVAKPANVTFEQAAAVPVAAETALQGLRKAGVGPGQKVLINGASGGVGTFAVQLAKILGAEVTGVCSARNAELVRSIGADHVIDYEVEDFTRTGTRYDVVFNAVGNRKLGDLRRALSPQGALLMVAAPSGNWIGPLVPLVKAVVMSPFVGQRLLPFLTRPSGEDLGYLSELLAAGRLVPVIDRTFQLSETAEAMRYLETGRVRGKVIITV